MTFQSLSTGETGKNPQLLVLDESEKSHTACKKLTAVLNMVAHFVSLLLTGFIFYTAWPGNYLFAWHPILMTVAFPLLLFQGICVFSPESSLLKNYDWLTKVRAHWIVQTSAVVCAVTGFSVIYYNKYSRNKPHFTSWHGLMGLVTVCYVIVQSLGGTVLLYSSYVARFVKRATLKPIHATSGLFAYTLASVTLFLGLSTSWFTATASSIQWYACASCLAVLLLATMKQVVTAYGGRPVSK